MIIDANLAEMLVRESLLAPYRQIAPMRSDRYVEWLRKRGIQLGLMDWSTLHHLWQVGILHPVAIRDVTDNGTPIPIFDAVPEGRLFPVSERWGGVVYADLGIDVADDTRLRPPDPIPSEFRDALLWHPFQFWAFHRLDTLLRRRYEWSLVLAGPDQHAESLDQLWQHDLAAVRAFGRDGQHLCFLRLVALLLAAEPLVHTWLYPMVRLEFPEPDIVRYIEWRDAQVGYHSLSAAGLTIAQAVEWHQQLSLEANVSDPVERFRKLLRHADRDEREGLKDSALRAHSLYDTAEVLRRYLHRYHWHPLPDEPDILNPEHNARVNFELYGRARTSDYERGMYRRIARRFGVDPGYRAYCFLEGDTEVGYVSRWCENFGVDLDRAGVRLVNLRGKDNIAVFEDQLRRLQEEEVFAVVCVDQDSPERSEQQAKHIQKLREFELSGVLPIDFVVWRPNFVQHNFTIEEVVAIVAADGANGATITLSPDVVERRMSLDEHGQPRKQPKTAEDAVNGLSFEVSSRRWVPKGERWGALLAVWATEHPAPDALANHQGERPIDAIIAMLLRGQHSDYELSRERSMQARKERQARQKGG